MEGVQYDEYTVAFYALGFPKTTTNLITLLQTKLHMNACSLIALYSNDRAMLELVILHTPKPLSETEWLSVVDLEAYMHVQTTQLVTSEQGISCIDRLIEQRLQQLNTEYSETKYSKRKRQRNEETQISIVDVPTYSHHCNDINIDNDSDNDDEEHITHNYHHRFPLPPQYDQVHNMNNNNNNNHAPVSNHQSHHFLQYHQNDHTTTTTTNNDYDFHCQAWIRACLEKEGFFDAYHAISEGQMHYLDTRAFCMSHAAIAQLWVEEQRLNSELQCAHTARIQLGHDLDEMRDIVESAHLLTIITNILEDDNNLYCPENNVNNYHHEFQEEGNMHDHNDNNDTTTTTTTTTAAATSLNNSIGRMGEPQSTISNNIMMMDNHNNNNNNNNTSDWLMLQNSKLEQRILEERDMELIQVIITLENRLSQIRIVIARQAQLRNHNRNLTYQRHLVATAIALQKEDGSAMDSYNNNNNNNKFHDTLEKSNHDHEDNDNDDKNQKKLRS